MWLCVRECTVWVCTSVLGYGCIYSTECLCGCVLENALFGCVHQYWGMGAYTALSACVLENPLCLGMFISTMVLGYGCTYSTGCLYIVALSGKPFVVVVALKKAVKKKKDG